MLYNKYRWMKMAEAYEGKGAGGGVEDAAKLQSTQQIELLTKSVGMLAEGLQKMEGNQNSIIETLAKITDQSKVEVKEQLQEKFGEDIDIEQLSRKDFASLIMESTRKALATEMAKQLNGVDEKVQNLAERFESKNANEQVSKTAELNPDFWEWSNEIKQLLKENPTLSVNRAYNLAKSENSSKATELAKKYNPPKEKRESSFIGLTPTSSVGTRDSTGKMSQKDAAERAFDKVMGELGDRLETGDMKIA